jgi:hypothetical protein
MRCPYTDKELHEFNSTCVSPDGDFVHNSAVKKHEADKKDFFENVIHDDKKFNEWIHK